MTTIHQNEKGDYANKDWLPHVMVYLGFLTTAISVPASSALIHRFAYVVYVALFTYLLARNSLVLHRKVTYLLVSLLLFSLYAASTGINELPTVAKTFSGLFLLHIALFSYFAYYKHNYRLLVGHYLTIAKLVAAVGIIQELSFLVGFEPGWNLSRLYIGQLNYEELVSQTASSSVMRISSFFSEPGYLAAGLSPAAYLAVNNFATGNKEYLKEAWSAVIIVALFFTLSTIGYIAIILSIAFNLRRKQLLRAIIPLIGITSVGWWAVTSVSFFQSRAEGLVSILITQDATGYENASAILYAMNGEIARQNVLARPMIGSGFDSFKGTAMEALNSNSLPNAFQVYASAQPIEYLNFADGMTMYFRSITEFGLIGTGLIIFLFYRHRCNPINHQARILQNMCIVFFLTYSFRTGQYIRFELWYFIGMYFCIYKKSLAEIRNTPLTTEQNFLPNKWHAQSH